MRRSVLGLKRGIVRLSPHRRTWKTLFARERARVLPAVRRWVGEIHHVGSTAIPGIPAKPILDTDTFVRSRADAKRVIRAMVRLGYHDRGEKPRGMWLAAKGPDERRTHYFHVRSLNRRDWYVSLMFRDYLRAHPGTAGRYAALKRRLARQHAGNRAAYTNGKAAFVKAVLRKARRQWPVRAFTARYRPARL